MTKKKKLILISGPDGFVAYHAGPKVWSAGKCEQGGLGGNLREVLGGRIVASSKQEQKQKQKKQEQEQEQEWEVWKL